MDQVTVTLDQCPSTGVLAKPILDAQGGTLLAAGTTLTADLLGSLRRRGVQALCLAVEKSSAADAAPGASLDAPARPESSQARLEHLFRHALRSGSINPLLYMLSRYRQGGS